MLAALAVCRFAHYAAALWLFGTSIYVWSLAPATLRARLAPAAWRTAAAAVAVMLVTAIAWLALQAASMGEGWSDALQPETLAAVLFETGFGTAWQLHGVLCFGVAVALAVRSAGLVCATSGLALASLGLIGHAAMQAGAIGWLHRANLAVHLLAAGFWLGGLGPLLATIRRAGAHDDRAGAITALRRFSQIGHVAVVAVVLTGIGNTVLILHGETFGEIFARLSPYRTLLAAKILVVAMMIGLALFNRYRIVPRLRTQPDAVRLLMHNSIVEIWLGLTAVALVSCFGLLDPHA